MKVSMRHPDGMLRGVVADASAACFVAIVEHRNPLYAAPYIDMLRLAYTT